MKAAVRKWHLILKLSIVEGKIALRKWIKKCMIIFGVLIKQKNLNTR
jgi:hypothetical protein